MNFDPALPLIGPGSGWAAFLGLAIYVVRGYITGNTVSRRENDATTKRAEAAEKTRDEVIAQNTELMEMAKLGQSVFTALDRGAK